MAYTRKHIFITGSVGVGKTSSITEAVNQCVLMGINVFYVREYIDFDPYGINHYDNWTNGRESLISFQKYICKQFREQLKTPEYMTAKLVIWERHPREALLVFSQTGLSDDERQELDEMITELEDDFLIPKLVENTPICYQFDMSFATPKLIGSIVVGTFARLISDSSIHTCFIYLFYNRNSISLQYGNICKRGRLEEINRYSIFKNLIDINNLYANFVATYLDSIIYANN